MTMFGAWASVEREKMGFVWLGTCEADPRAPGPPTLVWGRDRKNGLHVAIWPEEGSMLLDWCEISEQEWTTTYPHANLPLRLPDDYVEEMTRQEMER